MIKLNCSNNVYFSSIDDLTFINQWRKKLDLLPKEIVNHCLKFHQEADQKKRFLGYWLLKELLLVNGLNLNNLNQISFGKFKKPYFLNETNLHFNLSYSGDLAICALSNHPIGIDIEKINPNINLENYKSVFVEKIWDNIFTSDTPLLSFYTHWTLMEAVIKADGNGITGSIHQILYGKKSITFNNIAREFAYIPTKNDFISHVVGFQLSDLSITSFQF